jgi:hypothetical protein
MREVWLNLGQALKEAGQVRDAERALTKVCVCVCVVCACVLRLLCLESVCVRVCAEPGCVHRRRARRELDPWALVRTHAAAAAPPPPPPPPPPAWGPPPYTHTALASAPPHTHTHTCTHAHTHTRTHTHTHTHTHTPRQALSDASGKPCLPAYRLLATMRQGAGRQRDAIALLDKALSYRPHEPVSLCVACLTRNRSNAAACSCCCCCCWRCCRWSAVGPQWLAGVVPGVFGGRLCARVCLCVSAERRGPVRACSRRVAPAERHCRQSRASVGSHMAAAAYAAACAWRGAWHAAH